MPSCCWLTSSITCAVRICNVPSRRSEMATVEEYAKQPFEARLARMTRTPDELAAAIHDRSDAVLSRRPDPKNWAAKEVVCHLRDTEEVFFVRFHAIVENNEPKMYFQRQRAGIRGDRRITIDEFVSVMAWHDDNHLDQLKSALEGRP